MSPIIVIAAAFVGVTALVFGIATFFRGFESTPTEDRLDVFTGAKSAAIAREALAKEVLAQPLHKTESALEQFLARFGNWQLLFEQADTQLTPAKFFGISGGLALLGAAIPIVARLHPGFIPFTAAAFGVLPLLWLVLRRRRRLRAFAVQLPDALELMARALRAGHSLAAGFNLVADEMTPPVSKEFGRVFEEQNLGVPLEEALNQMSNRIPNLDLRFFSTAVILQRQTGGDLAEILDKIGYLVRERFKIWGQIQALTGEGRLSGIVLLALPPLLFLAVYRLNPDYVMVLFTDPLGQKMLAGGAMLQLMGALAIRKIINIKV
jgi:tight adherence protein B